MTLSALGIFSAAGAGGAVRVSVAGYIGGGLTSSIVASAVVSKFAFPSDTQSSLGTGLSAARSELSAMANSGVAGYFAGGGVPTGPTTSSTVDKFAFPADTRTTLGTGLNGAFRFGAGMSNHGVAGYFALGDDGNGNRYTEVNKFAFPSDSRTTLSTGLSAQRARMGGNSNTGVAGYYGGGVNQDLTNVSTVDKFAFPSDTRSTLGTGLSVARERLAGMSDKGVAGYFGGGNGGNTVVNKFAFPSDTRTTLGTGLSTNKQGLAGINDAGVAGYFGPGTRANNNLDKFAFPSDTRSTLSGPTPAREDVSGMSNEGVF
jgi:hypothetical protein